MKTIWLLTELYYPEKTSTGFFITGIAEGLAQKYQVNVITGAATINLEPVAKSNFEVHNNVKIFRVRQLLFHKSSLILRLISTLTCFFSIFWKCLFLCQKGDIILVVTNPPFLPFAALLINWIKGIRFVLLIHDVYPEALVGASLISPTSVIVQSLNLAHRILYRHADRIITIGRDMSQLVRSKLFSTDWIKVQCITNWADVDSVYPTPQHSNSLLYELHVADRFVFLYAGNMGRTHNLEDLVDVIQDFSQTLPSIHFIFIGSGVKKQWLAEVIESQMLNNIHLLSFRPDAEKNISLNACNVAIISFAPGMSGVSVPSRMYNQMAAGKPIVAIADQSSELALVIQEEGIGWVVPPGNSSALAEVLQFAANNPSLCHQMGMRAAGVARTKYTRHIIQQSFIQLFQELFEVANPAQLAPDSQ
jgi:colanic acid biosynthesis glycosyl transferase WcaI